MYSNLPCKLASPYITVVRREFGAIEPPQTHSKLLFTQASPFITMVEMVRCGRTTPNSFQPPLWACFPLCHSDSRRFGVFKPHQTHSNLPCRPTSPFVTVIRGGSMYSNLPKLIRTFPVGPLHPSSQWFEEVWRGPNRTKLTPTLPVGLLPPWSQ